MTGNERLVRVSATVTWEDCNEPQRDVFIETETAFAQDLICSPHAFLVGCFIPAMHFGEKRIQMEADVCPELKEGLRTAMALLCHWSQGRWHSLALDMGTLPGAAHADKQRRTGLFLSGGVDSLAALRMNRLSYPPGHPGAVTDCLLVHGFDIGGVVERGMKYHVFERAKTAMAEIAMDADVQLIPVLTNIRHLCDERELWLDRFFGAVLAAVAHAFAPGLQLAYIASSYDIPNLVPCGSHPMLDPEYSSVDVKIRHRDVAFSRLDKLGIIKAWQPALQNMRVCLANVQDRLNCGKCEKCVRTMIGLVAVNALHQSGAFVEDDVHPDLLNPFSITIRHREPFYREMLEPLKKRGRFDLVERIQDKLSE